LRNQFVEQVNAGSANLEKRCLVNCLQGCRCREAGELYCIVQALDKAARGDVDNGLVFAGSNAGRADRMRSVAELMTELVN
jgi:nitronate monooxygenase